MGDVNGNLFFIYIAPSGLGFKTPMIMFMRKILFAYDDDLISVSKFTPEGYTEYVQGTPQKVSADGKVVVHKAVKPHPVNIIMRDEASVILGETKFFPHLSAQKEYLSKLWDGWIEGYYTRKMQFEGNLPVYVSLCACASDVFFDLLDEEFFTQGLGNRILWITQEITEDIKNTRTDPLTFFFPEGKGDEEFDSLVDDVIGKLGRLRGDVEHVYLTPTAIKLWCEIKDEYFSKAIRSGGRSGSYCMKIPLNALKLAMNYAASCMRIDTQNSLCITGEDMARAIEDAKAYEKMWQGTMRQWKDYNQGQKREKPLHTSRYDLVKFVELAISRDGLITAAEIDGALTCPDRSKIGDILDSGAAIGWFTKIASVNDDSQLTPEQLKRFKPPRGFVPNVYKVTEKGRAEYLG